MTSDEMTVCKTILHLIGAQLQQIPGDHRDRAIKRIQNLNERLKIEFGNQGMLHFEDFSQALIDGWTDHGFNERMKNTIQSARRDLN